MAKKRSRKKSKPVNPVDAGVRTDLLTLRAYADHRGCSPEAVRKAISRGALSGSATQLPNGRWQIDPEEADREWERNTTPTLARGKTSSRTQKPPKPDEVEMAEMSLADLEEEIGKRRGHTALQQAFKFELDARAKLLQIREKAQELVSAAAVWTHGFELGRHLRDALDGLGARIAPMVISETDPAKAQRLIDAEVGKALAELVNGLSNRESR